MKKLYIITLLLFVVANSYSQLNFTVANTSIVGGGSYTDLGTNGTAITTNALGTPMTYDDDVSTIQSIGFTFQYNGLSFTQFSLHSNGFIKLGVDTPAVATYDVLAVADPNLIYPFSADLDGDASSEYRVFTEGSPGSKICTIQFKNVKDYSATVGQYTGVNFQIKLYEANSNVEFIYGNYFASTTPPAFISMSVGVKGTDASNSVNGTKSSGTDWLAALFISGAYTGNKFNNRNSFLPVPGTKILFVSTPPPNADASVLLYTLGKLPIGFETPHVVKAVVKNNGITALNGMNISLNISGVNTFSNVKTINLAVGKTDTISFDPFTPTVAGVNNVTVSIPNDDVLTNNSSSLDQTVTTNVISYADASPKAGQIGYNTGAGLLLTRYTMKGTALVSAVNVYVGGGSSIVGNKIYAVVVNSAGTIVGKSDSLPITGADTNTLKTYLIPASPSFTNEDYYVGLAQTATAFTGYFPLGYQTELPIRKNQYYTCPIAGGVVPTQNSSIGRFMIEGVLTASTVPLDFISFGGKLSEENVVLNWKTANEVNTKNFVIQRSINGEVYENIGLIDALSNSRTTNNYSFNDLNVTKLNSKALFYRLKQVDKDGKSKLSNVIRVSLTKDNNIISAIYPNPATKSINLSFNSPITEKVSLIVNDLSGKNVLQNNLSVIAGTNNLSLNVEGLPSGTYFIKVICSSGCEKAIGKFVKN